MMAPAPSDRSTGLRVDGPSLRELVASVAFEANRTIGGGNVSIELLRRRFTSRGWMDATTHGLFIAVSRFTPGTVVLAYCVSLGFRYQGWPGALIALTLASVPGALIVFGLTVTFTEIEQYAIARALLALGILVAGGLVVVSAWHLIRPYLDAQSRVRASVIVIVTVGLVLVGATPVRVLLAAAIVSCLIPMRDEKP